MNNVISLNTQKPMDKSAPAQVLFINDGEIDIRSVRTMGLSAKHNTNAIGYFGTGLKYAIAVLLRENQSITIYSGLDSYHFEKKAIDFRGSDFEIVVMHHGDEQIELPFTTELGKDWELWQAYRELHCNCTDEFGDISVINHAVTPVDGKTIIVCEGEGIEECYNTRATIVLDATPLLTSAGIDVINGASPHLFYKNIRAADVNNCLYTYNIKSDLMLTEDRTIKYVWMARGKIMNAVLESHDRDFIKTILLAPEGTFEYRFNFTDTSEATSTPSREFLDIAGKLYRQSRGNISAHEIFKRNSRISNGDRKESKLTNNQQAMFERAIKLAEFLGYNPTNYPIIITSDLEANTLGLAEDETIYINIRCFDRGTQCVAHALIEEFIHLEYGYHDESRALQNYLFEKVIALGAELHDVAL